MREHIADALEAGAAALLTWLLSCGVLALASLYVGIGIRSGLALVAFAVVPLLLWCWRGGSLARSIPAVAAQTAAVALLVMLAWLLASRQFDHSWDGVSYHQEAILQMLAGWPDFPAQLPDSVMYADWLYHYCKLPWAIAAALAAALGSLEGAMAANLLLMLAAFALVSAGALRCPALPAMTAPLLGLAAAANPVSIYQSMSFYVDGQLASLLVALLGLGLALLNAPRRRQLFLLALLIVLTMNVKQTGIAFAGLLVLALLGALALHQRAWLKPAFLAAAVAGLLGGLVVGYSPYATNTLSHGNPVYPLFGEQDFDIARSQRPPGFEVRNRFERLAISSVSAPTLAIAAEPELRLPLQFTREELMRYRGADIRLGGWGPLSSAALLLALAGLLTLPWIPAPARTTGLLALGALAVSVAINPEAWWARYNPQWILLPWVVAAMLLVSTLRGARIAGTGLAVLLIANAGLVAWAYGPQQQQRTDFIRASLQQVADSGQSIAVWFGPFPSNRQRLERFGIPFATAPSRERLPCPNPRRLFAHEGLYCPLVPSIRRSP